MKFPTRPKEKNLHSYPISSFYLKTRSVPKERNRKSLNTKFSLSLEEGTIVQLSFPPPSCVTSHGKHGSPDKSTIINTIAPSPSSPSPSSSPCWSTKNLRHSRAYLDRIVLSRCIEPRRALSTPFAIYPRSLTAFLLRLGRASRGNSWPRTASLLEKGGEGGIVDGWFEWQNVACNFTNIQHVAAKAWLGVHASFARCVCEDGLHEGYLGGRWIYMTRWVDELLCQWYKREIGS